VGGRTTPTGYVPLPQTTLAADEVRSWLTGAPDDARAWVSTLDGAAKAVQFSFAVQRAARAHQIQEQNTRLHRMHCPACARLLLVRIPPAAFLDDVTVKCTHCGWTQNDPSKIDEIAAIEAMPWKEKTA